MESPTCRVQGFLAAGHVCAVVGYDEYYPLAEKYHVPFVVTGFEPADIAQGVLQTVRMLERGDLFRGALLVRQTLPPLA